MSSRINIILVIGATAGIGEAFARRFHRLGKKVIITGRNAEKLNTMAQELPGLETRQVGRTAGSFGGAQLASKYVDMSTAPYRRPANLGSKVNDILNDFPSIDSVIINAGVLKLINLFDQSTTSPDDIATEITTNLTGPSILVHYFGPNLLKLAQAGTSWLLTYSPSREMTSFLTDIAYSTPLLLTYTPIAVVLLELMRCARLLLRTWIGAPQSAALLRNDEYDVSVICPSGFMVF